MIKSRRLCSTGRTSRTTTRSSSQSHVAIVAGAGIAGLSAALALHKQGIAVRVLEAGENLRNEGTAIGLWDNAWIALEQLGVADALRPHYLPLNM